MLFFLVVSEPVSEKFGTEKTPGTGLEKNLVPKKSTGTGLGKFWYRKKVSESVSFRFGVSSHTDSGASNLLEEVKPASVSQSLFGIDSIKHLLCQNFLIDVKKFLIQFSFKTKRQAADATLSGQLEEPTFLLDTNVDCYPDEHRLLDVKIINKIMTKTIQR